MRFVESIKLFLGQSPTVIKLKYFPSHNFGLLNLVKRNSKRRGSMNDGPCFLILSKAKYISKDSRNQILSRTIFKFSNESCEICPNPLRRVII